MAQMKKEVKTLPKEICNSNESIQLRSEHNESPFLWVGVCMCAAYLFCNLYSTERKQNLHD